VSSPVWHLYIVRTRDGSLYTGIATNVARRLTEHRARGARGAKYLRGRGPFRLVLHRRIGDRALALRVERRVKRLPKLAKETLVASRPARRRLLGMLDLEPSQT